MLDIELLRRQVNIVSENLKKRGFKLDIEKFELLESKRKTLQTEVQELQAQRNKISKSIGQAKSQGQDASELFKESEFVKNKMENKEEELKIVLSDIQAMMLSIPNMLHDSVPIGAGDNDNVEIRKFSEPRKLDFQPKDHVELGQMHGWMDFDAAARLAGSRFVVLFGPLVKLHRALINFMTDIHTKEHGYREVYVPYMANKECFIGTGQLPKFEEDLFKLRGEKDHYLIPTAEVPVTNLVRESVLNVEQLPMKFVCHTPCFRSESGSYGKDTRGMIRNHQFEKVELVQIVRPEKSYEALEALTNNAETILQKLELPYRVIVLCAGDTGFSSAKTYDLEVWLPSQNCYREISSCSCFESFQARRMQARFKNPETGKNEFVHTLNGSGLAVGRTLVAILENYQDSDGNIHIPKVLRPYFDGQEILS